MINFCVNKFFVRLIFVATIDCETIFTMKISRFMVHTYIQQWSRKSKSKVASYIVHVHVGEKKQSGALCLLYELVVLDVCTVYC